MATEGMTISNETRLLDGVEPVPCCLFHHRKDSTGKDDLIPRAGCKFCAAKAAALNRIKAAGGDSVKAAKDSASRASADVLLVKRVVKTAEGKAMAKPAGVVKKTMMVPEAYVNGVLIDPQLTPLVPLSEDYFLRNPSHREHSLGSAATYLLTIEHQENILVQYFKKGFAVMEVQIDYDC